MSEKIKSCCHAGDGEDHEIRMMESGPSGIGHIAVYCACGWIGPSRYTEEEAIAAWNRRPREDRLAKLLREAKESVVTLQLISTHAEACRYRATLLAAIDAALKEET